MSILSDEQIEAVTIKIKKETGFFMTDELARKVTDAAIEAYKAQKAPDARSACENYIESLGGSDSDAWHDVPVTDVFIAGFEAGRKSPCAQQ